jgi:hypothetical protein
MVVQRLGLGIMHPFALFMVLATPSGRIAFALSPSPVHVQPIRLAPFSPRHPFITSSTGTRTDTDTDQHLLEEEQVMMAPLLAFTQGSVPLVCLQVEALGLSLQTLAACKLDALCLQQAGFGAPAGVVSGQKDGIRTNVHQIWLQSPAAADDVRSRLSSDTNNLQYIMVGQMAARRELILWVDSLRQYLNSSRGISLTGPIGSTESTAAATAAPLLPGAVELSYVLYPTGAYYRQHVDQSQTNDSSRRAISFILYLGDPTSSDDDDEYEHGSTGDRPWDCVTDGGALRVYGSTPGAVACTGNTVVRAGSFENEKAKEQGDDCLVKRSESCRYYADITPTAGRLVIFDSATVLHEVRTTHRPRAAVVGWFRESVIVANVVVKAEA